MDGQNIFHKLLTGQVGQNAHPLHPILVHYPITSLVLSYTCDLAIPLVRSSLLPTVLTRFVPPVTTLSAISFYANAAGVLFAVPATITGTHEMWEIYTRQGTADQRVIKQGVVAQDYNEKAKNVGLLHGALNYGLSGVAIYNWVARRKQPSMIPTTFQSSLSAVALLTLIWSAYLGGELVYKYGIGVQRMGEGLDEKAEQWKGVEEKRK